MSIKLSNAHCAIGITSFGTSGSGALLKHKPDLGLVVLEEVMWCVYVWVIMWLLLVMGYELFDFLAKKKISRSTLASRLSILYTSQPTQLTLIIK